MKDSIIEQLSKQLNISIKQINTVLDMLKEGDTVPFIARYRKEATGALNEEQIFEIEKQYNFQ